MAVKSITQRMTISLTQGSADAFVQGSVNTALAGLTKTAYRITKILLEFPNLIGSGTQDCSVSITRRSKTAEPNITDVDVLYKQKRQATGVTSGFARTLGVDEYTPDSNLIIVEDTIYAQLDSTGTGLANTAYVVIEYEVDSISEVDRLSLLTQSLV